MPKYLGIGIYGEEASYQPKGWDEFEADNDEQAKPENSGYALVNRKDTGEEVR